MNKKHLISELSIADRVTLFGTLLILIAIWLLWLGKTELSIAIAFISMFCDYLDGTIARKIGGSSYGKVLDSLYDVLGFVLFPSLLINIESGWKWWVVAVTTVYCLSSVVRLSRFTVKGYVKTDKRYYVGVPVLFSKYAVLIASLWNAVPSTAILAVMIPLMISSRLFKKPHPFLAQLNLLYAAIFLFLHFKHV